MSSPKQFNVNTNFEPQTGKSVPIAPGIARITAPNASPYTFTGTNSFILGTGNQVALLDPGPEDAAHLNSIRLALHGRTVEAIILTHTHLDHSAGARTLSDAFDAPLWFGGAHRLSRPLEGGETNSLHDACDWTLQPARTLVDGTQLKFGNLELTTIATPGHCANHLAFGVVGTPFLFSGDHVMGWSSTLVATPDGSMADYFTSLGRLLALPYDHYLPAHGGPIPSALNYTRQLKAHRQSRNTQILAALGRQSQTVDELLNLIYKGLPAANRGAALMTLHAHLEYLCSQGAVGVQEGRQPTYSVG